MVIIMHRTAVLIERNLPSSSDKALKALTERRLELQKGKWVSPEEFEPYVILKD